MSDINGSLETISSFLSKYLPAIFKFMIVTFFLQNENFVRGLHGSCSECSEEKERRKKKHSEESTDNRIVRKTIIDITRLN